MFPIFLYIEGGDGSKQSDFNAVGAVLRLSQAVRMCCMRGGVNLYTFAAILLPQVRKQLNIIRAEHVENVFVILSLKVG